MAQVQPPISNLGVPKIVHLVYNLFAQKFVNSRSNLPMGKAVANPWFSSPLKVKFEKHMPKGWPYQLDLFKDWTAKEKQEILQAFNSLPKRLRDLGEINVYMAVKSSFSNNHASSGPDEGIIVL